MVGFPMFTLAEFAVKALQITGGHVLADSIFGVPLDRVQQGFGLAIGLRLRRGIEPVDGQALSATPGTRGRTRGRTRDRDGVADGNELSVALQLVERPAESPASGISAVIFLGDLRGFHNNAAGGLNRLLPCLGIGRGLLCNVAGDLAQQH